MTANVRRGVSEVEYKCRKWAGWAGKTSSETSAAWVPVCAAVVDIPAGVTEIPKKAFYECKILKTVTIPGSVTTIGREAFDSCSSLTSVTIPDSVTTIGDYAFNGCSSLKSVSVSKRTKFVKNGFFSLFFSSYPSFPASCVVTRY